MKEIVREIGGAVFGSLATIIVGWFTFREKILNKKRWDKEFILELQRQVSADREQANEQRIQDSQALASNLKVITEVQKQQTILQTELAEWKYKYFELSKKYNELEGWKNKYLELNKKYDELKNEHIQLQQNFQQLLLSVQNNKQ